MFETLENNPTLRDRVLGLTAIGAILIGGAAGVDTMLTSGWQLGGDEANAAPVVYADASPVYQDDVNRDWSASPPQRIQLAAQEPAPTVQAVSYTADLDGSTNNLISQGPAAATPPQQSTDASQQQDDASRRFDAIEADVQQATAALQQGTSTKDASETASPS